MKTIKKGSNCEEVKRLQKELVNLGYKVDLTGVFDEKTDIAVRKFQETRRLVVDGIVGNITWKALEEKYKLCELDYINSASILGVDVATIKAVCEVESGGSGFIKIDTPKILFEGHIFWNELKKSGYNPEDFVLGNEDILYKSWNKSKYLGGLKEYDRLEKAILINKTCAIRSTSWGLFQIMGFNYLSCGCDTVDEFVNRMKKSEGDQLNLFIEFIRRQGWGRYLRDLNWEEFAKKYNGPGYKENKYDYKLETAYLKYKE